MDPVPTMTLLMERYATGSFFEKFSQMFVRFTEMLVFSDVLVSFYAKYWLITGVSIYLYA